MKPATSYFSKALFLDTLRRQWWLGFVNLVVMFFAVPIYLLLKIQGYKNSYDLPEKYWPAMQGFVSSFFSIKGCVLIAVVTMVVAAATGLILFAYLHKKEQINFFHSHPVRRESLMLVRVLSGFVLFAIPYVVNMVLALFIAALNGMSSSIGAGACLGAIVFILLIFAVVFSVSVLSAVLTGTLFAQMEMMLILLLAPAFLYFSVIMLCDTFYSTFYTDYYASKGYYFSPLTHLFMSASGQTVLSFKICLLYLILVLALLAAALFLYRQRPSEGAGHALVFNITRPIVKYVCCFVAAVVLGVVFGSMAGLYFMIFGFAAGALLCSMFAEVQFNRDFKAMFRDLKGLALFAAGFAVLISIMAFDVTGYDRYQVPLKEIKSVSLDWDDPDVSFLNQRGKPGEVLKYLTFTSPLVKERVCSITSEVIAAGNYSRASLIDQRRSEINSRGLSNTRELKVIYRLKNGRQVVRRYRGVDLTPLRNEVQGILSSAEYKNKHVIMYLERSHPPVAVSIEPFDSLSPEYRVQKVIKDKNRMTALLEALKADVRQSGERVNERVVYRLVCEDKEHYSTSINIYESYHHTIGIINQIADDSDRLPVSPVKVMLIRPAKGEERSLVLNRPEEIEQVIKSSVPYIGGTMLLADEEYVVIVPPADINIARGSIEKLSVAEAKGGDRYFVLGRVPAFVKEGL